MTITELKAQIAKLPPEERRELMDYTADLNRSERQEFLRKLAAKMDDKSPERWMTVEEVEESFRSGGTV